MALCTKKPAPTIVRLLLFGRRLRSRNHRWCSNPGALLGTLSKPSKANKGWEGLAILPGSTSPDKKPRLVTVQEGEPPLLVICDRHPKKAGGKFEVEAKVPSPLRSRRPCRISPISRSIRRLVI
jgi:hypothetical protein